MSHVAVVVRLVTEHGSQRVEASEGRSLGVIRGESSSGALKSGESGSVDSERRKSSDKGIVSFLIYADVWRIVGRRTIVRVFLGRDAVDDGVVRIVAEHAIIDLILDSDQVVTAVTGIEMIQNVSHTKKTIIAAMSLTYPRRVACQTMYAKGSTLHDNSQYEGA